MESLSIYIHYPFCKSKCPYCDFNSHVNDAFDKDRFLQAYLRELEYFARKVKNRRVKTIFFGGGTPSLMDPEFLLRILTKISDLWPIDKNVEITLEANPTSFEADKFRDFKKNGINRLSIGIQALNDGDLKFLGRQHSAKEAINTVKRASEIFENYSFDLIYARPKQNLRSWERELKEALNMGSCHLSLYQLTIEKGTEFYAKHKKKEFFMPGDDLAADFYELTNNVVSQAGFEVYEISNYAKKGRECLHNLSYWESGEYLGIGAGAHSRIKFDGDDIRSRMMMFHNPLNWQDKIINEGHAIQEIVKLSEVEFLEELVLMGLRLKKGISNEVFVKYFGSKFQDLFDLRKIEYLAKNNFLEFDDELLKVTKKGRVVTNAIINELLG